MAEPAPRRALLRALGPAACGAMAGLAPAGRLSAQRSPLAQILQLDRLRVGIDIDGTQTAFEVTPGQPDGMAVRIADHLAIGLGLPLDLVPTTSRDGVDELRAGRFDILINPPPLMIELAREVLFADAYVHLELDIVAADTVVVNSAAALADKRIGVLAGWPLTFLRGRLPMQTLSLVSLMDRAALLVALESNQVDGVVVNSAMASSLIQALPTLELKVSVGECWIAPALRFGDHDLLRAVNTILYLLRGQGVIQAMHRDFYGRPLPRLPFF